MQSPSLGTFVVQPTMKHENFRTIICHKKKKKIIIKKANLKGNKGANYMERYEFEW